MACRQVSIQQLVATAPATAQYQARAGEQAIVVNSHAGLIGVPDQTEERVTVTTLELADPLLRDAPDRGHALPAFVGECREPILVGRRAL
jgi:hypothetical protein